MADPNFKPLRETSPVLHFCQAKVRMRANAQTLLVIVGPTAVGKTATAIELAERLGGEIVSADSRYLYRGMDIGTAKPTPVERARLPHHLIDVTTPDQPWTLAQFQAAALAAIRDIQVRARIPLLVGGTGQYIRAVTEGWLPPPGPRALFRSAKGSAGAGNSTGQTRSELEAVLKRDGLGALVARLQAVDPVSAERVDLRNPRRVIRALEVALTTGQSFAAQQRKAPPPWAILTIGLTMPRPALYARIDARVDAMMRAGLLEEVRTLAAQGFGWELPAMSALGYKQMGDYLRGECDLDEAVRRIKRETRRFVRRQANWFKPADPKIEWFDVRQTPIEKIVEHVRRNWGLA
jgi:tRNA dimethylallyltransferase